MSYQRKKWTAERLEATHPQPMVQQSGLFSSPHQDTTAHPNLPSGQSIQRSPSVLTLRQQVNKPPYSFGTMSVFDKSDQRPSQEHEETKKHGGPLQRQMRSPLYQSPQRPRIQPSDKHLSPIQRTQDGVIQREWVTSPDGLDDVWSGAIPNHEQEEWHAEWQMKPVKYWFEPMGDLSQQPARARWAGEHNAMTKKQWIRAGFGDVMKQIDAATPKNQRESENISYEYGVDEAQPTFSINGNDATTGKVKSYVGGQKAKASDSNTARAELENVNWAEYQATDQDRKKWQSARRNYDTSGTNGNAANVAEQHGITPEELEGVGTHLGGAYMTVNPRIGGWGGAPDKTDANYIRMLASGLNKLPPHQGTVYRGDGINLVTKHDLAIGKTFTRKEVLSSSRQPSVALGFNRTSFSVIQPTGGGKWVQALSWSQHEDEVLFPPQTQFQVTNIKTVLSPFTHEEVLAGKVSAQNSRYLSPTELRQLKLLKRWRGTIIYMTEIPNPSGFSTGDFGNSEGFSEERSSIDQEASSDMQQQQFSTMVRTKMAANAKRLAKKLAARPTQRPDEAKNPTWVNNRNALADKLLNRPAERPPQAQDPQDRISTYTDTEFFQLLSGISGHQNLFEGDFSANNAEASTKKLGGLAGKLWKQLVGTQNPAAFIIVGNQPQLALPSSRKDFSAILKPFLVQWWIGYQQQQQQ